MSRNLFTQNPTSILKLAGKLVIPIMTILAIIVGIAFVSNASAENKRQQAAADLGYEFAYAPTNTEADARWEKMHTYLESIPAPSVACYTNPFGEVDYADRYFFGDKFTIAESYDAYASPRNCYGIAELGKENNAALYSVKWWDNLDSIYAETGTHFTASITFRKQGFKNAAEYMDFYISETTAAHYSHAIHIADDGIITELPTPPTGLLVEADSSLKYTYAIMMLTRTPYEYEVK